MKILQFIKSTLQLLVKKKIRKKLNKIKEINSEAVHHKTARLANASLQPTSTHRVTHIRSQLKRNRSHRENESSPLSFHLLTSLSRQRLIIGIQATMTARTTIIHLAVPTSTRTPAWVFPTETASTTLRTCYFRRLTCTTPCTKEELFPTSRLQSTSKQTSMQPRGITTASVELAGAILRDPIPRSSSLSTFTRHHESLGSVNGL